MRMRAIRVLILWLAGGLIIGFLIWYLPLKLFPRYTAQTFIRVLPASKKGSAVALIKSQNNLESLINSDTIQQTGWFGRLGATQDERMTAATAVLKRRLNAKARPDSDLVTISMTCRDGQDAAIVLNEIVDLFLKRQQAAERKRIATALSRLEEQQIRIQRDLDTSEGSLDGCRIRYGFSDLEQHDYPHPITARLIRLQNEEDNCALEIKKLEIHRDEMLKQPQGSKAEPNLTAESKDVQFRLKSAQGRLAELKKMREEAAKQQEELDMARAAYAQRLVIRDERRQILDSVKSRAEELKILHDAPDAGGMQLVESAVAPRQADMQPWQTVIPTAVVAAAIAGIVHLLLTKKANSKNPL
jgi:uncharacterized protein involved in exopolysaccharide biosynthesis